MPGGKRFQELVAQAKEHVHEVDASTAAAEQQRGAVLIDVREAEEFGAGHAPGAKHLSRGTLELKIEEAAPDAQTPIICYCGGGSRSALAAESLQRMGYSQVRSLAGGFKAWREAGLPVAAAE